MMRYQLLGPSGLRVSELCPGTMSFGDAWGFGADEKESHRSLGEFADAGGNFVDTAKYHEGQSEEILGSFLGPGRDRWVVATKYTLAMRPGDPNAAGNSRKNLRSSVEASLRRLRTDYSACRSVPGRRWGPASSPASTPAARRPAPPTAAAPPPTRPA
jgi:aryl-alcohol dehydrogenase-like predicted oxidoreductase